MIAVTPTTHLVAIIFLALLPIRAIGVADDASSLALAKDLYVSAAYDEALAMLDALVAKAPPGGRTEAAEYRLFCLLALERRDDARKAIAAIVTADPFYQPSDALASPRIRTVFKQARRELLPGIVQGAYADAKTAFERKDPTAAMQFERVLALLNDADISVTPALTDLRTVVAGFLDLSRALTIAAPAPAPTPPPLQAPADQVEGRPPSPPATAEQTPRPPPVSVSIATNADSAVTPPIPLFQPMPVWTPIRTSDARLEYVGTLEIMIDEQGNVMSAKLTSSVHPRYDQELLKAARTWKFTPALRDGAPTRYLRVMEIRLRSKS